MIAVVILMWPKETKCDYFPPKKHKHETFYIHKSLAPASVEQGWSRHYIWSVSSSRSESRLNTCVGRSEWSPHLSPEEFSVHQSCRRRCVCHWGGTEQARLCGEGGLATWPAASQASSDPPMCCGAALFPLHNAKHLLGPIVRLKALLSAWAVQMVRHSAFIS